MIRDCYCGSYLLSNC